MDLRKFNVNLVFIRQPGLCRETLFQNNQTKQQQQNVNTTG